MKLTRVALSSFLFACMTLIPFGLTSAEAGLGAMTGNSATPQSLNTASFVLYATSSSSGANSGTVLALSRTSNAQFFYSRNTGNVDFVRLSMSITYDNSPDTVTLLRCNVGVAFSGTNTCRSCSTTTVTISSGVVMLAFPSNSWFQFQIDTNKTATPTISVSISSSQIRPGITTHS